MSEIYERVKKIRESKGMSQAVFAKLIGVGQSTLGMMEVGKRNILDRHIKTICSICNINEEWLRYGKGDMLLKAKSFSLDEYAKEKGLTNLELDILHMYMDLDQSTRRDILEHFRKLFASSTDDPEDDIEKEVADYRNELEEEKSIQTSSASQNPEKSAI